MVEIETATRQTNGEARDWNEAGLSELIHHIVSTHHAFLNAELPEIQERLNQVVENHGAKNPELYEVRTVFLTLREEIEGHLRKEEYILFPAIEELEAAEGEGRRPAMPPFGTVRNPIRMMLFEHDNAGGALGEMRRLTHDYTLPEQICPGYRALFHDLERLEADLHLHIHLENNVLFPRAAGLEARLR
jgi:regulator of cell morphogenesis and NO signaling